MALPPFSIDALLNLYLTPLLGLDILTRPLLAHSTGVAQKASSFYPCEHYLTTITLTGLVAALNVYRHFTSTSSQLLNQRDVRQREARAILQGLWVGMNVMSAYAKRSKEEEGAAVENGEHPRSVKSSLDVRQKQSLWRFETVFATAVAGGCLCSGYLL